MLALGGDVKGKASVAICAVAVASSFVAHWLALGLHVLVAIMWRLPDPRIEKSLGE